MSQYVTACVLVEGVRPLLWHYFGKDALSADGQRKEREGAAGNNPGEWRKTVLFDAETRQLYIPAAYLFACLRDAAKKQPRKRGESLQGNLVSCLQVTPDNILVIDCFLPEEPLPEDPSEKVYLDIRGVKNPNSAKGGSGNIRYRVAAAPGWRLMFHFTWDCTLVSRNSMVSIVNDAGVLMGIGDGRQIGMGRFKVLSYEVEDAEEQTTA